MVNFGELTWKAGWWAMVVFPSLIGNFEKKKYTFYLIKFLISNK